MPTFDTPEPISATLEFYVGHVRIVASDRTDTVVEIRPSDEADESDVQAAQQMRVDCTDGTLRVIGPKRVFDFSKRTRSVDVFIELPSGSRLSVHPVMAEVVCTGRLGECRIKTTGNVRLEHTGPLRLHTGHGHVTADHVAGNAQISTASGRIQVGTIEGTAEVKSANGDVAIDAVGGDVRVRTANGLIDIGRSGAGVDVKTANGDIRLGELVRGSAVLETASGDLDVGIAEGTAAWLEMNTGFGHVRNRMDGASQPGEADETVEVRGRTGHGDITIHRS